MPSDAAVPRGVTPTAAATGDRARRAFIGAEQEGGIQEAKAASVRSQSELITTKPRGLRGAGPSLRCPGCGAPSFKRRSDGGGEAREAGQIINA